MTFPTDRTMEFERLIPVFPLLAMLCVAAVIDLRERRIPNWLNALVAVAGVLTTSIYASPVVWWASLLGLLLGFAILLVPFALGFVGGGDVKVLAAVGAWLGPLGVIVAFLAAQVVSLVVALFICIRSGRLTALLGNSTLMVTKLALVRDVGVDHVVQSGQDVQALKTVGRRLPYAVSIALGVAVAVMLPIG